MLFCQFPYQRVRPWSTLAGQQKQYLLLSRKMPLEPLAMEQYEASALLRDIVCPPVALSSILGPCCRRRARANP